MTGVGTSAGMPTPWPPADDPRRRKRQLARHRRERCVALGPCMRLQFEDELTIRSQLEGLWRSRPPAGLGLRCTIDDCARWRPDGTHWKATLLFDVPDERRSRGDGPPLDEAARCLYVDVRHHPRVFARFDDDVLGRASWRPAAAHLLYFAFPERVRSALLADTSAVLGCDHDLYAFRRVIPLATRRRLRRDLIAADVALEGGGPAPAWY